MTHALIPFVPKDPNFLETRAHRDFVAHACRMTRRSRFLSNLWLADDALRTAACNALHDLIMEGV